MGDMLRAIGKNIVPVIGMCIMAACLVGGILHKHNKSDGGSNSSSNSNTGGGEQS